MAIAITIFAWTTIVGMYYSCEKSINYAFGDTERNRVAVKIYMLYYICLLYTSHGCCHDRRHGAPRSHCHCNAVLPQQVHGKRSQVLCLRCVEETVPRRLAEKEGRSGWQTRQGR